jgi:hypothetical protein
MVAIHKATIHKAINVPSSPFSESLSFEFEPLQIQGLKLAMLLHQAESLEQIPQDESLDNS